MEPPMEGVRLKPGTPGTPAFLTVKDPRKLGVALLTTSKDPWKLPLLLADTLHDIVRSLLYNCVGSCVGIDDQIAAEICSSPSYVDEVEEDTEVFPIW